MNNTLEGIYVLSVIISCSLLLSTSFRESNKLRIIATIPVVAMLLVWLMIQYYHAKGMPILQQITLWIMVFMIVKSMQVVWSKAILKINPTTEEILKDVSSYVIVIGLALTIKTILGL